MHNSLRQKIQHWIATAGFDAELGAVTSKTMGVDQTSVLVSKDLNHQTIANNSTTKITWAEVEIEDSDIYTADLSNERIEILEDGTYSAWGCLNWSTFSVSTTSLIQYIYVNGSLAQSFKPAAVSTNESKDYPLPRIDLELTAGDYVDVRVNQYDANGNSEEVRAAGSTNFGLTRSG